MTNLMAYALPKSPQIRKRNQRQRRPSSYQVHHEESVSNEVISIQFHEAHQYYAIQVLSIDGTILLYQRVNNHTTITLNDENIGDYTGILYVTLLGVKGAELNMLFRS